MKRIFFDLALSFVFPVLLWLAYLHPATGRKWDTPMYGGMAVVAAVAISLAGLWRMTRGWPLSGRIVFAVASLLFLFGILALLASGAMLAGATTMP